ncbi:hypothetical protein PIROE2DRAFT_5217 [Piromyces sp. E2]|nr:hypothetical protein PIROE2DRAFT_5217 [Piromyces sp. E2]|eukprot:OUM67356.1 hypothetical protein PIROE2DRAFT_5217 [Piromyces sp. E2]
MKKVIRETSVTVKPGYNVYWFYHAFTNKCLYTLLEPNNPITIKLCDNSDYSISLELGKCDDQTKMVHDNNAFLGLIKSSDKCIGFLNKDLFNNEIEMKLNI